MTLDATGSVAVNDPRQWARDASVRVFGGPGECSGTLVSPRVVLTAAHCVRPTSATTVWFSPLNPNGDPGDVLPGTPAGVTVGIARCAIHPDRNGACGDGYDSGGVAQDDDLAVLVLNERFDASSHSRYRVIPAEVVDHDPNNTAVEWVQEFVWMAGYGREGVLPGSRINGMRLVAATHVLSVFSDFGEFHTAHERGYAGDSGCGVFVFRTDDGSPLQLLGVHHAGNLTSSLAVLLTASPLTDTFLGDFIGPKADHYPGAMVTVGTSEVWTGGQDLPRADEVGRLDWRDPGTGQSAQEVDPDGDGLRGRHDNCWGIFNPRQRVNDLGLTRSCTRSTGEGVRYGCAPRPAVFDGLGTEIDNDRDDDGTPDACDNCPVNWDPSQRDCDEDGLGDVCEPDRDLDSIPNDCDNCPSVRSRSGANCNEDAEIEAHSAPAGDVCDATPCGETEIVALESSRAGATELRMGYVEVDGRSTELGAYPTGFRTCPCSAVAGDSAEGREECRSLQMDLSGDCDISDLGTYDDLAREPRTWRWNTIDGIVNPEPVVPYGRYDGTFELDLRRRFDLRLDFDRWALLYPEAYPHGTAPIDPDADPIELLFWTRTLTPIREQGGRQLASDLVRHRLANHYWSGEVAAPFTFGAPDLRALVAAAGIDASACSACAAAFPAPFVIRPCPSFDPDCAAQTSLAFAGGSAEIEAVAPRLRAFTRVGVERWVSSTDNGWSRTPEGARFVGLAEGGTEIVSILSLHGGILFDELGHVCQQCLVSPLDLPPEGAVLPRPPARSGFAAAMSGANGRIWMAGGVGASGEMLHDLWEVDLEGEAWRELGVSRRELGDVLAMVWSAPHRALYLLDAVGTGSAGFVRLLRVPVDGEVLEVEQRWPRLERSARYALAVEPSGALWIVGSRPGSGEHVALRLVEPRGQPAGHVVDAYAIGEGELVLDGVWASSRGLSVLVADTHGVRPVGHVPADLRPGRGGASRCF